jgi:hypothetical protein
MLPIRKVVLFKHGVGFFEREGEIEGDASIDLHFKSAEMNDVLKSLTTLDLTSGLISSISYESTKPVEKQLEDIAIRLTDPNALTGLLAQVKGARVAAEVGARRIEGVVTGIEAVTKEVGDAVLTTHYLALLVDGASLQAFDLLEVKSLAFLDESLRKDLQHLLDILISAKKKDLKKLTIFAVGQGKRRILASYIVETPVWKTSYRVLLGKTKPLIQGWAIVDNTQDEDWENVSLSLVAGLPISFVHDLYSPRYMRRPVVEVQEEEAYAPPVLEAPTEPAETMDGSVRFAVAAAAPSIKRMAVGMEAGPLARKAEMADARARSVQIQTRAVEAGDLFQYDIRNPVTVKRNQSALVPILQGDFEGKRVAVYNPEVRDKNPMSAVLFKNTTGLMLEGGPVTVLEDEGYVGEAMLDTMKPGEERLVPFSVELGCVISIDPQSELQAIRLARILHGTLSLHQYRISRTIYVIANKTDKAIDLFLEHRFNPGWELVETEKPVEKTENYYRFRLDVPPKKTVRYVVSERGDECQSHAVRDVGRDQLRFWLESKFIDTKAHERILGFVSLSDKIAAVQRRVQETERDIQEIFKDQERLRNNLKALGSAQDEKGLRERYVAEMAREEDALKSMRDDVRKLKEEKDTLDRELESKVGKFQFESHVE